jgi:hypothetical protein
MLNLENIKVLGTFVNKNTGETYVIQEGYQPDTTIKIRRRFKVVDSEIIIITDKDFTFNHKKIKT